MDWPHSRLYHFTQNVCDGAPSAFQMVWEADTKCKRHDEPAVVHTVTPRAPAVIMWQGVGAGTVAKPIGARAVRPACPSPARPRTARPRPGIGGAPFCLARSERVAGTRSSRAAQGGGLPCMPVRQCPLREAAPSAEARRTAGGGVERAAGAVGRRPAGGVGGGARRPRFRAARGTGSTVIMASRDAWCSPAAADAARQTGARMRRKRHRHPAPAATQRIGGGAARAQRAGIKPASAARAPCSFLSGLRGVAVALEPTSAGRVRIYGSPRRSDV